MTDAPTLAWPLARDTVSPSALKTFQQCPEQFRRNYIHGEWGPSSWSSVLGNAVHGAQEVNLGQKAVTGRDLPLAELEGIYSEKYDREVDDAGGISSIVWTKGNGDIVLPSKCKDIGRPVNRLYHELVAPTIQPLRTEVWIKYRVPGVVPEIRGRVDVMKLGGGKIDLKFGGTAPREPRKDWLLQARIYNLADDTPFEWHTGSWGEKSGPAVNHPGNAPLLLLPSTPDDRDIAERLVRSIVAAIVAYYRMFGPDEPWPGDGLTHTFACDYCAFRPGTGTIGGCPYWPSAAQPPAPLIQESLL